MNKFQRTQQWLTFARQWYMLDANWQDVDKLSARIAAVLKGENKPIYHPLSDCGDHVIVYNCQHVSMNAFKWKHRQYYFDNRFPKGKAKYLAADIHLSQPTRVLWMETSNALPGDWSRRKCLERLHLFADEHVPEQLLRNVSDQLRQVSPVPKKLEEYSQDEKDHFPALFDWPDDFVIDPPGGSTPNFHSRRDPKTFV